MEEHLWKHRIEMLAFLCHRKRRQGPVIQGDFLQKNMYKMMCFNGIFRLSNRKDSLQSNYFLFNVDLKQSERMKNHQNGNNNKKMVEKTHACKATQEQPGILSWI